MVCLFSVLFSKRCVSPRLLALLGVLLLSHASCVVEGVAETAVAPTSVKQNAACKTIAVSKLDLELHVCDGYEGYRRHHDISFGSETWEFGSFVGPAGSRWFFDPKAGESRIERDDDVVLEVDWSKHDVAIANFPPFRTESGVVISPNESATLRIKGVRASRVVVGLVSDGSEIVYRTELSLDKFDSAKIERIVGD